MLLQGQHKCQQHTNLVQVVLLVLLVAVTLQIDTILALDTDRCTAIIVGKDASANGHPMTTHTNDCSNCDFRIAKVPARHYYNTVTNSDSGGDNNIAAATMVVDIPLVKMDYPRYVGSSRGPVFEENQLDESFRVKWSNAGKTSSDFNTILGTIPQVNQTYGYIDGLYGIINEHQVAIGESTCGGRLVSLPLSHGGKAMMDVTILSRLAMERTTNAKDAVQLMGDLAVKYGYYGAVFEGPDALGESGEALTVTDPKDAWIFHVHPDDTGESAVWVAQRVPENHISVVANQFVIQSVNLSDSTNFLGSSNLYSVAERQGFWTKGTPFSFTEAYSLVRQYGLHVYSTRRVWRVFTLANPSLKLSPETNPLATDYPFSVQVLSPLTARDIMSFNRDHYEGTAYDMTVGPQAGPYGNPDRYDMAANGLMSKEQAMTGHFERAISIFRASYSFVSQLSNTSSSSSISNAKIWFGQYAPHATTYFPIYVHANTVPAIVSSGSLFHYDPSTSYWAHAMVGNWVSRFYKYAIPFVKQLQHELEANAVAQQDEIDHFLTQNIKSEANITNYLTLKSVEYGKKGHVAFEKLFQTLVALFHDGYQVHNLDTTVIEPRSLFYPQWWLNEVGYFHKKDDFSNEEKKLDIRTAENTASDDTVDETVDIFVGVQHVHPFNVFGMLLMACLTAFAFTALGVVLGRFYRRDNGHLTQCGRHSRGSARGQYQSI